LSSKQSLTSVSCTFTATRRAAQIEPEAFAYRRVEIPILSDLSFQ